MSILQKIKDWFTGKSSNTSTKKATRISNYGGGGSRAVRYSTTSRARDLYQAQEDLEEKRRKEREQKAKERTAALAEISKRTDDLSAGKAVSYAGSGVKRAIKKIEAKSTPDLKVQQAQKSREDARAQLKKIADDRAALNKATNNRYNTEQEEARERLLARQRIRSGEMASDPTVARVSFEQHPIANLVGRQVAQGASFGLANPIINKLEGDRFNEEEELYRRQREEHPWISGGAELAGGLLGFGLTGGMSKDIAGGAVNTVGKALGKGGTAELAEGATAKLLKSKFTKGIINGLAEKEAARAVEAGVLKEVSKEALEDISKNIAQRLVNAVGEDMAINMTTGAIADVTNSLAESESLGDFIKNMGINAGMNLGLGGLLTVAPALRTSKGLINRTVRDDTRELLKNLNLSTADDTIEDAIGDAVARNADEVAPPRLEEAETAPPPLEEVEEEVKASASVEDKRAERDRLQKEYSAKKKELQKEYDKWERGEPTKYTPYQLEEEAINVLDPLKDRIDELDRELGTQAQPRKTRSDKGVSKKKAEPPKPKEAVVKEQPKPRTYEDVDLNRYIKKSDRPLVEARRSELEAERMKLEATGNKADEGRIMELSAEIARIDKGLSYKQGQKARVNTAKLAEQQAQEAAEQAKRENIHAKVEAGVNAPTPEPTAQNATASTRDKVTSEVKKGNKLDSEFEDVRGRLNNLVRSKTADEYGARQGAEIAEQIASNKEKERLVNEGKDLIKSLNDGGMRADQVGSSTLFYRRLNKKGQDELREAGYKRALTDTDAVYNKLKSKLDADDTFTLNDIADMLGVRRVFAERGVQIPEDVERTLTRVTAESLTDFGQGLKVASLMLRDTPEFKMKLIKKDFNRFVERVCNGSNLDDIKRSLDANHGESGWLDKQIKALSEIKDEKAFKEKYVELTKEIFRNSEPTLWDIVNLVRHSFMLSALKTGENNILGNISQLAMYSLADKLTIAGEHLMSKTAAGKGMRRTTALLERDSDLRKLAGELRNGSMGKALDNSKVYAKEGRYKDDELAKLFNENVKEHVDEAMGNSKYGFESDKGASYVYDNGGKLKRIVHKGASGFSKGVGFMLNEPDSWFVEKSYRLALAKYLQANGVTTAKQFADNPTLVREASEHAMDVALENTYKKMNRVTTVLENVRQKGYRKDAKWYQRLAQLGLDAELPYLKVPTNLVVNNFKYSPAGLLKSGIDATSAMRRGDTEALNKAVAEMSKGLTGTGLALVGFLLNCDDQTDDDSWGFIAKARDELKEYGVRDNSLKIGDKNLNISNMGIGTVQFLIGARFAEEMNENGGAPASILDVPEALLGAFNTTFDAISDMSLLDNALGIFDAVSNKGDYDIAPSERIQSLGLKMAGDYIGQFTPAPLRAIARGTAQADLDTNVKKGDTSKFGREIERNVNNIVSSIPVANEKFLAHKVDRHGNLINEKKNAGDKLKSVAQNFADPFNTKTVRIPDADKVELKVKDENGQPYMPKHFDENRTFKADIGKGDFKETYDLTRKEREQAARSVKESGGDMAHNVVYTRRAWFGDSHGDRAKQILRECPTDEEKAREYLYNTPEFKALSDDDKREFMDDIYDREKGRGRTSNKSVYVDIKGGDEGDFNFLNDLTKGEQNKYASYGLEDRGISKGVFAEAIQAIHDAEHEFKDGKNVDTINGKINTIAGIKSLGLSAEENIAIYEAVRGNRRWKDWDGVSGATSGYRRYGRGYRRWHRRGGSSKKAKVPAPKTIKASSLKSGEALVSKKSSSSAKSTLPELKRVKAKIDLPTVRK